MHISMRGYKQLSVAHRFILTIVNNIITLKTSSLNMQDSRSQCKDIDYLWNHKNLKWVINYNPNSNNNLNNNNNNQLIYIAKQHQQVVVTPVAVVITIITICH